MAMLALATLLAVAVALAIVIPREEPAPPPQAPFALVNVGVVDVSNGTVIPGQTVVVRGGKIASVQPASAARLAAGVRIVDASGKFVMPALWDMHAHVYAISPLLDLPLYIAYGVTNVRDMMGCPAAGDPFIACHADKQR